MDISYYNSPRLWKILYDYNYVVIKPDLSVQDWVLKTL